MADLKRQWRELFGKEPPPFNRPYLQSRLAYRIQELAYGGLKPETLARLEALGERLDGGNVVLRRIRGDDKPVAGTRLVREHGGVEHTVTVLQDGYEWQGRPYRSVSAIARAITGTRCAASKARGMWMGGSVPLGYQVRERKLVVDEAEAARVRRVFEGFVATGSATRLVPLLRGEGVLTKTGRPFDKGSVYKLLNNRTYLGEVAHKGKAYPGEHQAILPQELWDAAHAIQRESARARASSNRSRTPALLRGLLFGPDGRAMSPTHTRRRGRLYRYYVSQAVLKGTAGGDCPVRRLPAAEIEVAVVDQVRAQLRQPEVVVGTWLAARAEAPDLTEAQTREALERLDPLWDELFPAEHARIVRLLVERVDVGPTGADIRLRTGGLAGLVRHLAGVGSEGRRAA